MRSVHFSDEKTERTEVVTCSESLSWQIVGAELEPTQYSFRVCPWRCPLRSTVLGQPSPRQGFPGGSAGKESACNVTHLGLIPGLGRSPREGNGNPLQYSGLENSMDCMVHWVAKSRTLLSHFHLFHLPCTVRCQALGTHQWGRLTWFCCCCCC